MRLEEKGKEMFVGSLVRHNGFIGIVTAMKIFPSGLVRSQVEWATHGEIAKGLWWNSSELEVLDSDDINILRGSC